MAFSRTLCKATLGLGIEAKMLSLMAEQNKKRKGLGDDLAWSIKHGHQDIFKWLMTNPESAEKILDHSAISIEIGRKAAYWAVLEIIKSMPTNPSKKILVNSIIRNNGGMQKIIIDGWGEAFKKMKNFEDEIIKQISHQSPHKELKAHTIKTLQYFLSGDQIEEIQIARAKHRQFG